MAKIAALPRGKLGQSLDNEIALAPITWRTAQRMPGLAGNLRCEAVLEIDRHVARKEQPRSGTHALGVFDVGAAYSRRGDALQPLPTPVLLDGWWLQCLEIRRKQSRRAWTR